MFESHTKPYFADARTINCFLDRGKNWFVCMIIDHLPHKRGLPALLRTLPEGTVNHLLLLPLIARFRAAWLTSPTAKCGPKNPFVGSRPGRRPSPVELLAAVADS